MKYLLEGQVTERLLFRQVVPSDFDAWLPLFEVPKVPIFLGLKKGKSPKAYCQAWFDKVFHRYDNDLGGLNALVDKKTKQLVGQCGLLIQTVEEQERLEIGYSILPTFWQQGYATEAAIKCKNYAFENNFRESLISIVHIDNIGSEKVARKNGMSHEKTIDTYKEDIVKIFRIDKKDWFAAS